MVVPVNINHVTAQYSYLNYVNTFLHKLRVVLDDHQVNSSSFPYTSEAGLDGSFGNITWSLGHSWLKKAGCREKEKENIWY